MIRHAKNQSEYSIEVNCTQMSNFERGIAPPIFVGSLDVAILCGKNRRDVELLGQTVWFAGRWILLAVVGCDVLCGYIELRRLWAARRLSGQRIELRHSLGFFNLNTVQ